MNKLEQIRASAGIVFEKSFGCKEAERNIHLLDKDQFFEKFVKRLDEMGYKPLVDFEFNVIRLMYKYQERHHIGRTYEWKYFYSTTFEITQDTLDYLLFHKFIVPKVAPQQTETKKKEIDYTPEQALKINEAKLKNYIYEEKRFREAGKTISADNMKKAIEKCEQRIQNIKYRIEMDEARKNNGEEN